MTNVVEIRADSGAIPEGSQKNVGLSKELRFWGQEQKFGGGADLKADHLSNLARMQAGRRCDPLEYYARFPARWRAFLHGHFVSHEAVALFFDVSEKCAEKWWNGVGGPHAGKLAYAVTEIAGAAAFLFAAE